MDNTPMMQEWLMYTRSEKHWPSNLTAYCFKLVPWCTFPIMKVCSPKSDGSVYLVCTASSFINVGTLLLTYCTVRIRDALLLYSMYSISTVMYPYSLASTSALLLVGSGWNISVTKYRIHVAGNFCGENFHRCHSNGCHPLELCHETIFGLFAHTLFRPMLV